MKNIKETINFDTVLTYLKENLFNEQELKKLKDSLKNATKKLKESKNQNKPKPGDPMGFKPYNVHTVKPDIIEQH